MLSLALALAAAPQAPSVVVVLMDDVGRDKVAVYGDHPSPPPTPNLDALASRGVLFRNAWAYPNCSPTRAALLTGRHSDRTGIGDVIPRSDGYYTPLPLAETILPEALPDHLSVAFGKWHLADTGDPSTAPIVAGFDAYVGHAGGSDYFHWTRNVNGIHSPASGYYTSSLVDDAIHVLGRAGGRPAFLYFCPKSCHAPFHVPPRHLHSYGAVSGAHLQHEAMVEALDTELGRLFAAIDLSTTYLFVLGDNGSPRATVTAPFDPNRVKGTAYEGGVRVPFLVAGPGVAEGRECDAVVSVTDLFATVLELVGRPGGAEDSLSFAPLLAAPDLPGRRHSSFVHTFPVAPVAGSVPVEFRAIRTARWKLLHDQVSGQMRLYDLATDPLEANDLLVSPTPPALAIRDRLLALMPVFP